MDVKILTNPGYLVVAVHHSSTGQSYQRIRLILEDDGLILFKAGSAGKSQFWVAPPTDLKDAIDTRLGDRTPEWRQDSANAAQMFVARASKARPTTANAPLVMTGRPPPRTRSDVAFLSKRTLQRALNSKEKEVDPSNPRPPPMAPALPEIPESAEVVLQTTKTHEHSVKQPHRTYSAVAMMKMKNGFFRNQSFKVEHEEDDEPSGILTSPPSRLESKLSTIRESSEKKRFASRLYFGAQPEPRKMKLKPVPEDRSSLSSHSSSSSRRRATGGKKKRKKTDCVFAQLVPLDELDEEALLNIGTRGVVGLISELNVAIIACKHDTPLMWYVSRNAGKYVPGQKFKSGKRVGIVIGRDMERNVIVVEYDD